MSAKYGEVDTTDHLTGKTIYNFRLSEADDLSDPDHYCYGEIIVPPNFERLYRDENGVHFHVDYHPFYKKVAVCFRIDSDLEIPEYVKNRATNDIWFPVFVECAEGGIQDVYLSELSLFNEDGNFNVLLREGYAVIFSGAETDFCMGASKVQNEVFLLKASAGNLYQYPTIGVGLVDYLNSNLENNGLAGKLQTQFTNDRMIIKNAYMDSSTGELLLEVEEKEDVNG